SKMTLATGLADTVGSSVRSVMRTNHAGDHRIGWYHTLSARSRSRRGPHHGRADEWRHPGQLGSVKGGDGEAGLFDRRERGPVAVAADHKPVEPVETVLRARALRGVRPDVLDEPQFAPRP